MPAPAPGLIGPQPLPLPSAPLALPDGSLEPVWYRFFLSLQARTGGVQGVDAVPVAQDSSEALALSQDLSTMLALVDAPEAEPQAEPDGNLWQSPEGAPQDDWAPCLLAEPV